MSGKKYFAIGHIVDCDPESVLGYEDGVIPVAEIELHGPYNSFEEADDAVRRNGAWGCCWIVSPDADHVKADCAEVER